MANIRDCRSSAMGNPSYHGLEDAPDAFDFHFADWLIPGEIAEIDPNPTDHMGEHSIETEILVDVRLLAPRLLFRASDDERKTLQNKTSCGRRP
jgi:hypothetical protein